MYDLGFIKYKNEGLAKAVIKNINFFLLFPTNYYIHFFNYKIDADSLTYLTKPQPSTHQIFSSFRFPQWKQPTKFPHIPRKDRSHYKCKSRLQCRLLLHQTYSMVYTTKQTGTFNQPSSNQQSHLFIFLFAQESESELSYIHTNEELSGKPEYNYKSTLRLINASFSDTGYYYCHENAPDQDLTDQTKFASVYLYVAGKFAGCGVWKMFYGLFL